MPKIMKIPPIGADGVPAPETQRPGRQLSGDGKFFTAKGSGSQRFRGRITNT